MINFDRNRNAKDWKDPRLDADRLVRQVSKLWLLLFSKRPLLFFNQNLREYLKWRSPIAECMKLGTKVAYNDKVDHADLDNVTTILADRMDSYSLYNLACTYPLFAKCDQNIYNKVDLETCFKFLEKSLDITKSMQSLDAGNVAYFKALRRANNDTAFDGIRECREFKDLVTEPLNVEIDKSDKAKAAAASESGTAKVQPAASP